MESNVEDGISLQGNRLQIGRERDKGKKSVGKAGRADSLRTDGVCRYLWDFLPDEYAGKQYVFLQCADYSSLCGNFSAAGEISGENVYSAVFA